MTHPIWTPDDNKYETDKKYTQVGDEWISLDNLVEKKDVLKLVDVVERMLRVMYIHDTIGENGFEYKIDKIRSLKENLK